jgi:hypothetical protein
MLRDLVVDWYKRRVRCTVRDVEAVGECGKHMLEDSIRQSPVEESDLNFMLFSIHAVQRDVQPHWWFAACVE